MQENDQNFNDLKIHTQYAICEGAIKVDDLKEKNKRKCVKTGGSTYSTMVCEDVDE